jgi:hypothetical protein
MIITNTVIAMSTIQSNSSSPSAIEIAGRTHRNLFIAYLVWLLIAAAVTATFTWALWRASNRKQDAVIAATNERAAKLEKEVADARRMQVEAETRLAEAQMQLAQLKKKLKPRRIRPGTFKAALVGSGQYRVEIGYPKDNDEAFLVAWDLASALREVPGWNVSDPKLLPAPSLDRSMLPLILASGGQPLGITVRSNNLDGAADSVYGKLRDEDFEAASVLDPNLSDNSLRIIIAPRL